MKKDTILYDVPIVDSIQDMILQSSKKFGTKLALEDLASTPINRLTYHELLEYILKFGTALNSIGIKERTHIAIIGDNRVQWALGYLTAMCFNLVIVPIDKNLTTNEILNIIYESDAEGIIFSRNFSSMLAEGKSYNKKMKYFICMDETREDKDFLFMADMIRNTKLQDDPYLPTVNPDEMAEIIFTSGSLGRAKGVMLSQKNLASNLMDMVRMVKIDEKDRFLSVLPMHHTYECTCGLLCPMFAGSSAHYARSLKTIVDDLQNVKATMMLGVPLLYDKMFKRVLKLIKEDKLKSIIVPPLIKLTSLLSMIGLKQVKKAIFREMHEKFGGAIRLFVAGGAASDPIVAKGLREFGFGFIQGYGLTEASPILALNRVQNFKDDAAGLPLPHVQIKINKPDSNGSGEIWAKAPSIMIGYYKNEKATSEAFTEGWFRTGDIGFVDEDGFIHINGRMKNVIISKSGKNVFPEEVEDVLSRSPFVLECLVFGEEDPKQGEIISAQIVVDAEMFIELAQMQNIQINDELLQQTIAAEVEKTNKQLAGYKQIKKFYIKEKEFEKTTTQKIKRYLVKNGQ